MPGSWKMAYVGCPFYKTDDSKQKITCEGLVENSSIALIYRSKEDFEMQINAFCCQSYKKCEVYRMLMEKYEE